MINLHNIRAKIEVPDVVKAVAYLHPNEHFVYDGVHFYTYGTPDYPYPEGAPLNLKFGKAASASGSKKISQNLLI